MSYKKKPRQHLQAPWVSVTRSLLDQPAWKAMSFGARALYIALKRFYNTKVDNNGKIYLSCRDACEALGTRSRQSIARWFAELEFYGFIVKTTEGCLGVYGKGIAPHYRLTECMCYSEAATRDYERWDGTLFVDPHSQKQSRKKQNPVPVVGTPRPRGGYIQRSAKTRKNGRGVPVAGT
jgi:hypothetical protein